jgi:hypothetical protein
LLDRQLKNEEELLAESVKKTFATVIESRIKLIKLTIE